jgi:ATP-binding cassette, subfamily B, bacterial
MSRGRDRSLRGAAPGMRRIIARFWPQIRKQKFLLTGSFLAMLGEVCLRLLEPWPLKFIFDRIITEAPNAGRTGIGFIDGLSVDVLLVLAAASVVVITGLRAAMGYLYTVGFALAGSRIVTAIRGELYGHLQRLSLAFHSRARAGDLITRLTGDVNRLQEATVTAALPLTAHILTMCGMVIVMFLLNYQLALVAMVAYPLVILSMYRFAGPIQKVSRKQRQKEGELASTAAESLGAIKVVQALSLEAILERVFTRHNRASLKQGVRAARLTAGLERSVDLVIAIGSAMVLWYGARLVMSGTITPGDLLVFVTYMKNAVRPMRDMAKYTARLAKATAAGERVVDILERSPDVRDRPGAIAAPPIQGEVQFQDVSFGYDPARPVLQNINFSAKPGQRVALVGPSGAGKSSLAGLLLRLYDVTDGAVLVDGTDIRDYKLDTIRPQMSVVLQESVLFAVTARENIGYAAPSASDEDIEDAARLANAHEFISALPDGYETILGERGATLSGGERQRIAIARAALRDAPIVVLDEPTTGLDRQNAHAVNEALARLTSGRTTFVIAHELAAVQDADLILYLDSGQIVERGTHPELLAQAGRYATVYALQDAARSKREYQSSDLAETGAPLTRGRGIGQ